MKIAVFATGWNGEYLRDMYHGLENSQKEFHDSIHLYASFGRLGSGDSFNKSEFDFFELADMEAYDGFLYPSTTVKEGDVKQRLLERIIESKKPCVSLEEEIPGLSFVGINQSKAMRQIVRHLAGVHGIRTFGFINGMKDTYEAQMRQQGVESKIRELGLCLMPEWVDYGNYEYRSGETYARKMIAAYEAGEELPQAVISANDLMAAAFLQTIKGTALEGKIPVTGFDRYFDGECFSPTMTTIERPRDQVAYEAVRLLHELHEKADGKLVHRELSYRFFIGNTCGCTKHVPFDTESFRNRIFWKNLQEYDAKSKLDSMQEWVTSRISLEEIMDATGRFLDLVGAGRGQIFLTDDLFSQEAKSYRSCKREVLNWCNEKNRTEEGGVQVFMPLHYQLFAVHGKPDEIHETENELNALLARQGKLNEELKQLKKVKKQLMESIVANMDGTTSEDMDAQREKKLDEDKRLIDETNQKMEENEDELLEIPRQIRDVNRKLMLQSMGYFYEKIRVNKKESDDIDAWINQVRVDLKKNIIRKQNRDINNREIYAYLHDIFGPSTLDLFDIHYEDEDVEEDSAQNKQNDTKESQKEEES